MPTGALENKSTIKLQIIIIIANIKLLCILLEFNYDLVCDNHNGNVDDLLNCGPGGAWTHDLQIMHIINVLIRFNIYSVDYAFAISKLT